MVAALYVISRWPVSSIASGSFAVNKVINPLMEKVVNASDVLSLLILCTCAKLFLGWLARLGMECQVLFWKGF